MYIPKPYSVARVAWSMNCTMASYSGVQAWRSLVEVLFVDRRKVIVCFRASDISRKAAFIRHWHFVASCSFYMACGNVVYLYPSVSILCM